MSLDLYLLSKLPEKRLRSGIYARVNGETKEVLTLEEFKECFPDCDTSQFELYETDTSEIWSGNATHNLCEMAEHIEADGYNFYQLLWHPNKEGITKLSSEYRELVFKGLYYMLVHRKELEKHNPSNGWGSYESLLKFVQSYCNALTKWDGESEVEVYAST